MRIARWILSAVLLAGPGAAATPMPEIPTRAACDAHFAKPGDVKARYGTMQIYLSCLLTGSPGTLVLEANRLSDTAEQGLDRLDEDAGPELVVATLRNGRAMNNLSRTTLRYLSNFLYQEKDAAQRGRLCKLGELVFETAALLDQLADLHEARLDERYPEVAAAMKESEQTTQEYCRSKYDAYRQGRMREPERNFVFPESYMQTVVACAEQGIDFYGLIDAEAHRSRAIGDDPFDRSMDALERIDYHCHLHEQKRDH